MGLSMSCLREKRKPHTEKVNGTDPIKRGVPRLFDCCYGLISFPREIYKLLRTPEVQRLRQIGQLGLLPHTRAYWAQGARSKEVDKGAIPSHTRYAHSIGVAYLGQLATQVFVAQGIFTERDVLLITVAGLFHDTGHITFSHAGDHALRMLYPALADPHEIRSQYLTQHVLRQSRYHDMFTTEEVDLIVHMIHPKHRMPGSTVDYDSQRVRRMSNFISNVAHGMDVDQMDYVLFRDPLHLRLAHVIMPMPLACIKGIFARSFFDDTDVWRFHAIDYDLCRALRNQRSYLYKEHYLVPAVNAMDVMFVDILRVLERQSSASAAANAAETSSSSSSSSSSSDSFKPAPLVRWADVRSADVHTWLPLTDEWFIVDARAVIDGLFYVSLDVVGLGLATPDSALSSSSSMTASGELDWPLVHKRVEVDWALVHQLIHSMWPGIGIYHASTLYVAHRPQALLLHHHSSNTSSRKSGQHGAVGGSPFVDRGCFMEMSCPPPPSRSSSFPIDNSPRLLPDHADADEVDSSRTMNNNNKKKKGSVTWEPSWPSPATNRMHQTEKGSFKKRDASSGSGSSSSSSSSSPLLVPAVPSSGTMRISRVGFAGYPCLAPHCNGQHLHC
jgi:HD superfamily phosphohydrolase